MASSAVAAFGIGTLLLALQGEVSATTIQVANVAYKCLTTVVSRLTHPSERLGPLKGLKLPLRLTFAGVVGYCVCTSGVLTYTLTRGASKKEEKKA